MLKRLLIGYNYVSLVINVNVVILPIARLA